MQKFILNNRMSIYETHLRNIEKRLIFNNTSEKAIQNDFTIQAESTNVTFNDSTLYYWKNHFILSDTLHLYFRITIILLLLNVFFNFLLVCLKIRRIFLKFIRINL